LNQRQAESRQSLEYFAYQSQASGLLHKGGDQYCPHPSVFE